MQGPDAWNKLFVEMYRDFEPPADLANFLSASRLFAYHGDAYTNAACRGAPFSTTQLIAHVYEMVKRGDYWRSWFASYTVTTPAMRKVCATLVSPFDTLIGRRMCRETVLEYVEIAKRAAAHIHSTFVNVQRVQLPTRAIVYRGLYIPIGKPLRMEVVGFTSSSSVEAEARHMAVTSSGHHRWRCDLRQVRIVVLEIELPAGTWVASVGFCTIQDENEVVIVSQGTLVGDGEPVSKLSERWYYHIDANGAKQGGPIPYELMRVRLEPGAPFPELGELQFDREIP